MCFCTLTLLCQFRTNEVGDYVRAQLADSFVSNGLELPSYWGYGTMVFCTHAIMARVVSSHTDKGVQRAQVYYGPWQHAQTANIGGMGVRMCLSADLPRKGVGVRKWVEFAAQNGQLWDKHVGMVKMFQSVRSICDIVVEDMVKMTVQ